MAFTGPPADIQYGHHYSNQFYQQMPLPPTHPHNLHHHEWPTHPPPPPTSTAPSVEFVRNKGGPSSSSHESSSIAMPLSKLTPSCSRCRSKKLRCKFDDVTLNAACTNCLAKGLGGECHRDVRIARGKRRRDGNRATTSMARLSNIPNISGEDRKGSETEMNREKEINFLRKRLEELEALEKRDRKPPSPASTTAAEEGALQQHDSTPPDFSNSSDVANSTTRTKKRKDVESAASIFEGFAAHGGSRQTSNSFGNSSSIDLPRDTAQEKWQKSTTLKERLSLLQQAKKCPIASDVVVVRELVSVYLYRVNHLTGHVIYGPGFQRAVEAFFSMSIEEIVTSRIFVDPCCLSTLMLVVSDCKFVSREMEADSGTLASLQLCLGFEFHPWQLPPGHAATPGYLAVQSIRQRAFDPTLEWYSIARRSLAIEESYRLSSIPALQAACLFLVRGKESRGWSRMLHQVAISSAQDFGLHRLGRAEAPSSMETHDFIRLECGVRIWNFLAMRDWSLASDHGNTFLIQPEHCTTRKPLNLDDEVLESGSRTPKPMTEWTMMSFVITQIELSELVRDSNMLGNRRRRLQSPSNRDECSDGSDSMQGGGGGDDDDDGEDRQFMLSSSHRSLLRDRLNDFTRRMPHYFTSDSTVNSPGLIHVQRWLINQQIFDLQLRVQRSNLTNSEGQASCLLLAENILTHQANIRNICPVIDSLQINFFHLFGACLVVLLDLLEQHRLINGNREIPVYRNRSRAKVLDALTSFHGVATNSRSVRVLEVLLAYEEECYSRAQRETKEQKWTKVVSSAGDGSNDGKKNEEEDDDDDSSSNGDDRLSVVAERLVQELRAGAKGREYVEEKEIWPALLSKRSPTATSIPDQSLLPTAGAWRSDSATTKVKLLSSLTTTSNTKKSGFSKAGFDSVISAFGSSGHSVDEVASLPVYQPNATDHGPVFDWALGLGFDPFEGFHHCTPATPLQPGDPVGGHQPSLEVITSSTAAVQYTHERYLRELDNFNPIRVEKLRQQRLQFGGS